MDREEALEALGSWRRYSPEKLKELKELKEFLDNEDFIFEAVSRYGDVLLSYASNRLRNEENFILKALKYDSNALSYASERLRFDKNFVVRAILINHFALSGAPPELCEDLEIAKKAIGQDLAAMVNVPKKLLGNIDFMKFAIEIDVNMFYYALDELQEEIEFVKEVIDKEPFIFTQLPASLRSNFNLMLLTLESAKKQNFPPYSLMALLSNASVDIQGVVSNGDPIERLTEYIENKGLKEKLKEDMSEKKSKPAKRGTKA